MLPGPNKLDVQTRVRAKGVQDKATADQFRADPQDDGELRFTHDGLRWLGAEPAGASISSIASAIAISRPDSVTRSSYRERSTRFTGRPECSGYIEIGRSSFFLR